MLIISFPRSGQHLFERLLGHIYKYYNKEFSYCEFYGCCRRIPYRKNCLFQKNHDFTLKLPIGSSSKFIVLYRKDKIIQLESYFRYEIINKKNSIYYDNFIKKYISPTKIYTNSFIIEYDDFIKNYKVYISNLIIYLDFIYDDLEKDVENIINTFEKIEYKNNISNDFYNKILENI